jgi:hypothetical protein
MPENVVIIFFPPYFSQLKAINNFFLNQVAHVYITVAYKLHLQGKYELVGDYVDKVT